MKVFFVPLPKDERCKFQVPTQNLPSASTEFRQEVVDLSEKGADGIQQPTEVNQQQRFGPWDLTALLKNMEKEITAYETLLTEEVEKRKKYKVYISYSYYF